MTNSFDEKVANLKRRFQEMESAVVAFSGGVDSSVLVTIAQETLGEKMCAVTAVSPSFPDSDRLVVKSLCSKRSIPHVFTESMEFEDDEFLANPDDRCYHCKKHIYKSLIEIADSMGFKYVVEGTNASDLLGHRPGYRASQEFPRVVTPLVTAKFTKEDVRRLAREMNLPTAEKPSAACLSSRIPVGTRLDPELLRRIDAAEEFIRSIGAAQVRVRHHSNLARIEVDPHDMAKCIENGEKISAKLKELGWTFIALDLTGYRTGGSRN